MKTRVGLQTVLPLLLAMAITLGAVTIAFAVFGRSAGLVVGALIAGLCFLGTAFGIRINGGIHRGTAAFSRELHVGASAAVDLASFVSETLAVSELDVRGPPEWRFVTRPSIKTLGDVVSIHLDSHDGRTAFRAASHGPVIRQLIDYGKNCQNVLQIAHVVDAVVGGQSQVPSCRARVALACGSLAQEGPAARASVAAVDALSTIAEIRLRIRCSESTYAAVGVTRGGAISRGEIVVARIDVVDPNACTLNLTSLSLAAARIDLGQNRRNIRNMLSRLRSRDRTPSPTTNGTG